MKKLFCNFFLVVVSFLVSNFSYSNDADLTVGELIIENKSSVALTVIVYPIGAIFNGGKNYSLTCIHPDNNYDKIIGGEKTLATNDKYTLDHDAAGGSGADAAIGYGKYRVDFLINNNTDTVDYCDVDYSDADYAYLMYNDIVLYYYSSSDIRFKFNSGTENSISVVNRYLTIWDQYGGVLHKTQNKNGFVTDASYSYLPINAVDSGAVAHLNPNEFYLNLQINNDISTRDSLFSNPTNIVITPQTSLKINSGKFFNMITPDTSSGGYNNLIIKEQGALILLDSSKINVNSPNKITLKNGSSIKLYLNSEINISSGAFFCNEGAIITGQGRIIYEHGFHQPMCNQLADYKFKDSVKLILDTNAILEIPDSTTLHLTGNTTSLILKPNSKLKFGQNSKILIDSGAKLIANNAEFSSVDSTKKWDWD